LSRKEVSESRRDCCWFNRDNVRIAGSVLNLAGPVAGDALMAGSTMTVQRTAHVSHDALLAGATMDLLGPVARDVKASDNRLTIASRVGGGIEANITDLVLADGASAAGPVAYTSNHDATIAPTVSIGSGVLRTAPITARIRGKSLVLTSWRWPADLLVWPPWPVTGLRVSTRGSNHTHTPRYRWPASILRGFVSLVGTSLVALVVFLLAS
jgi:hypothetical protein